MYNRRALQAIDLEKTSLLDVIRTKTLFLAFKTFGLQKTIYKSESYIF
jgi:hypothetical protein